MCGIAGIFSSAGVEERVLRRMTASLAHRGPDDDGVWIDQDAGIGLGHRRLSIVDVSPAGHQPMHSPAGRYVITFNGEIYNHAELRRKLAEEGHKIRWRGHCDTETLLAAFDAWGIKATLQRASGMFAFALWDREKRTLILARDRLGEKPLYYGRQRGNGPFLFGSELKALRQHPDFEPEIDREALGQFVRYLAVPAPYSIYRGIRKLPPGTFLSVRQSEEQPKIETYWSGAEVALSGAATPIDVGRDEAINQLEEVLERAVARQMMSDVSLGAFLSGGIDSSTVVAIMQKISSRPVKTFTIGFNESGYNEAEHAKAIALHLGTEHTELYVTANEAMDVIPLLPTMYDEPFADSSQIPTYLVSALARQHVTVSLSGDGGDELFGGYDRYWLTSGLWDRIAGIPLPLRAVAARAVALLPESAWNRLGDVAGGILPRSARVERLGEKVHKGAPMLESESVDALYDRMISQWRDPRSIVVGALGSLAEPNGSSTMAGLTGVQRMMAQDMLGYLPDDILAKVDRASMAVSLESRVPLLDPEVVEFACRLPLDFKIRGSTSKWILRQVLYRHVPARLIERPKMGFGVPLDRWLRGPLRDWAQAQIDDQRLAREGYFHPAPVREAWNALLRGDSRQQHRVWAILIFQSWFDAQQLGSTAPSRPAEAMAG